MRSWRLPAAELAINDVKVEAAYIDVFVVVRPGDTSPGPNDWEATVQTAHQIRLRPGAYQLRVDTVAGHVLEGCALLRFSDGNQHLFRGDGPLDGVADALD